MDPWDRDRRAVGLGLLLVVLTAVGVLAALFRPDVAGTPRPQGTEPPSPGTCLVRVPDGVSVASCDQPHLLQVTRSRPVVAGDGDRFRPADAGKICDQAEDDFLGRAGDVAGWRPVPLRVSSFLVRGPSVGQSTWAWSACAIFPVSNADQMVVRPGYRGSMLGGATMAGRPAELRSCYQTVGPSWTVVPCATDHDGEFLGEQTVRAPGGDLPRVTSTALMASCAELARALIGHWTGGDPRVRLVVRGNRSGPGHVVTMGSLRGETPQPLVSLRCAIEGAGGNRLTDTVIGAGELPVR